MQKILTLIIAIFTVISAYSQNSPVIIPKPLKPGSKIAMVTPSSSVYDEIIDSAFIKLQDLGYDPIVYPHARGQEYGSYAANEQDRAADLMAAFADPEIDAVWCNRGGYGLVRLLPLLDADVVRSNPKWVVGYSDISALHAFMHKAGVASIHGPMSKHIASEPDSLLATQYLFDALTDKFPLSFILEPHPYNKYGNASGRLVGGNLLVINGLSETQWDMMNPRDGEDVILFFEDVSEQIYAIERVLMRLHYSGILGKVKGLVIGQFTDYRHPTSDFDSMEDMIYYWLKEWGYYDESNPMPIVFNFPTGHVSDNYPMIISALTNLYVSETGTLMEYPGN